MSQATLKLALFARALISQLHSERPGQDHDGILNGYLRGSFRDLAVAFDGFKPDSGFDEFAERCLDELQATNSPETTKLLLYTDDVSETGTAQQQSGAIVAFVIGGAITTLTTAVAFTIILACRLRQLRYGKLELDFFEGVPTPVAEIIKKLVDRSSAFDDVVKRNISD